MSDSKSYHDMQWAIYKARILKLLKNNRVDLRNTTGALPGEQLPVDGPSGAGYPPEAHAIGGALHTGSLTDALHGNLSGGALHANVTAAGAAGFMTGADKTKLDGIASGATANTGTVTSVALTAPAILSVAGSPVTTSGTLALSLATQSANRVFAGPTTGAAAAPTFRALIATDMAALLSTANIWSASQTFSVNTAFGSYTDYTSLTAPANPSTGTTRLYASSRAGTTIDAMAYRTSLGTEVVIGRDLLVQVRNVSGATIAASQVVYCSGSSASIARIELAQADATMAKLPPLGITTAAIANNTNGLIMTRGVMILDTSGFAAGDTLYLSPTTPGAVTNVVPSHPNVEHVIGVVEFVNSSGLAMISIVPINLHRIDGTNQASFAIGDGTGTTKSLLFKKAGSVIGTLSWNPTASRTITLPDVTGTMAIASATAGQVYFAGASGVLSGDSALYWDNTNKRLGIGTTSPARTLAIDSGSHVYMAMSKSSTEKALWGWEDVGSGRVVMFNVARTNYAVDVELSNNYVGIGNGGGATVPTQFAIRGVVSSGGYFDGDAIGAAEIDILATGGCVYQFAIGTSLVRSSTGGLGAGSLGGVIAVPGAGSTTGTFYNDGSSILGVRVYSTGRVTILRASGTATFKAAFFYVGM